MERILGVISDTHGLLRPEAVEQLKGCALILHAGDLGGREVLEALRGIAPVVAVRGNVDPFSLPLPETGYAEFEEKKIYVIHDLARMDIVPRAAGIDLVVYGHSHRPETCTRDGVVYLNPGSAGPRRFDLPVSMAKVAVRDGRIVTELVTLKG